MLGTASVFHFEVMVRRAAIRTWTNIHLCFIGILSIPRLRRAKAGEGVRMLPVIFANKENTGFQKLLTDLHSHSRWNIVPLELQFLQQELLVSLKMCDSLTGVR